MAAIVSPPLRGQCARYLLYIYSSPFFSFLFIPKLTLLNWVLEYDKPPPSEQRTRRVSFPRSERFKPRQPLQILALR
jgi:hypothetical protein